MTEGRPLTEIRTFEQLQAAVREIVTNQPVTDMHTHLYSPNFGDLLLWGIDELLTYHYLIAEVMRWSERTPESFMQLSKSEQADHIWQHLFLAHSPVSEACRGVLTTLSAFGFDLGRRDLQAYREHFRNTDAFQHVDRVFQLANVDHVVMTNDPFDDKERAVWLSGTRPDARFHAALRIDPLLMKYGETKNKLKAWGYQVGDQWDEQSIREVRRFLRDWIQKMNPLYMAVSLTDDFTYPADDDCSRIIRDCILPECREAGIPFAMMIGVKRKVNPALGDAGDYLGKASMRGLEVLLAENPDNRFLVTMLSRENQHELAVLARKFSNIMVFGCWWFLNNPLLIEEMTRMRLELLGTSFVPQHSDSRILDQLVYKWQHSKEIIIRVLTDKYNDILHAGWVLHRSEIERDVADLLNNNFWRFVGKPEYIKG
jgi:hypothetical protein